jgi:hypothetical protein
LPHKRVEILLHIKDHECDPAGSTIHAQGPHAGHSRAATRCTVATCHVAAGRSRVSTCHAARDGPTTRRAGATVSHRRVKRNGTAVGCAVSLAWAGAIGNTQVSLSSKRGKCVCNGRVSAAAVLKTSENECADSAFRGMLCNRCSASRACIGLPQSYLEWGHFAGKYIEIHVEAGT